MTRPAPIEKRRAPTGRQKMDVWQRQNGLCAICARPVGLSQGVEWDHRVPLGLTGTNATDNWQAVHPQCHGEKTAEDVGRIAKAKRQERKHALTPEARAERERRAAKKRKIPSRKADKTWKKKLNGETVRR